jgi:glycoprotein 3-alpha-L-fucosyltransferase
MTYRQDSDIVHSYGRYILRNLSSTIRDHQSSDYYLSSTTNQSTFNITSEYHRRENRILWIVSNCHARSRRNELARKLNTSFPIDQFGQCSANKITDRIEDLLVKYKFYLAFENAQCEDYITEKLFYNSLIHGSIPIVLGASPNNYQNLLPMKSFIHIEQYQNLSQLGVHLKDITERIDLFQSYHQWRQDYRIIAWKSNYFIDDRFCDLCLKLHEDNQRKSYTNFSQWLNRCR